MVLLSNDFVTDRNACSSDGVSVSPVKWKPCNVSAVRVFTQGCGSIVQPVNVGSQEANASSSLIDKNNQTNDTETIETRVKCLSLDDVSKSTEDGKVGMTVDEISGPVYAVIEVDDNGGSVIMKSIRKRKITQRRGFVVIRDFPPGLNVPELTEEERIRINGKRSFKIEDEGAN